MRLVDFNSSDLHGAGFPVSIACRILGCVLVCRQILIQIPSTFLRKYRATSDSSPFSVRLQFASANSHNTFYHPGPGEQISSSCLLLNFNDITTQHNGSCFPIQGNPTEQSKEFAA